jgi:NAD(P)-dependent dehydrogenase (short-subunit alcohol dehydrogenase family)/rhamnose utilization protein RhaD (predicted bifunctional aldolase and dehydrogenase)
MADPIQELIAVSRHFGADASYVIAGGGNTSYKNETDIWVKASGTSLATISAEGFAVLSRSRLREMYYKEYSKDPSQREAEVKADLYAACHPGITVRPSVETSLHEIINYAFVVHTHPTLVNAVMCANQARETITSLFGNDALFVPCTDPGYVLFTRIRDLLTEWRITHPADPVMIFLQNHGVFVSGPTPEAIKAQYARIDDTLSRLVSPLPSSDPLPVPGTLTAILPAIRMMLSEDRIRVAAITNSELISWFLQDKAHFDRVALPFTPDQIVYCKARALWLEQTTPEAILKEFSEKLASYTTQYGFPPKMIALKGYGLIGVEETPKAVDTLIAVFTDWMKISYLSEDFGGPHFMTEEEIAFIDNWEVENYRRQVAKSRQAAGRVDNKVVIVTGGAQGFGGGIAETLMADGANVVIADLNAEKGSEMAVQLNRTSGKNKALFVKTDVSAAASVEHLIAETVASFGGVDVVISNAGILRAGSLDEMNPDTFDLMTRVNYNGYFLCAKYASAVMKLQHAWRNESFCDIIQINSKSGLKGSNKNFAYAGGKFGGIGLTQSFALELMPYRIKVNSICPGNFFDGPLWSDPENGLFVQYLKTGKVPGAKTLEDVKAHYERQVPAGRGCRVADVMKAIYYVIEQEYETGQAVPVTGGQEMLR